MSSAFPENRNSVQKACIQKIKSVVVTDGVCESMLVAILTPAAFLHQRYWPVRPRWQQPILTYERQQEVERSHTCRHSEIST